MEIKEEQSKQLINNMNQKIINKSSEIIKDKKEKIESSEIKTTEKGLDSKAFENFKIDLGNGISISPEDLQKYEETQNEFSPNKSQNSCNSRILHQSKKENIDNEGNRIVTTKIIKEYTSIPGQQTNKIIEKKAMISKDIETNEEIINKDNNYDSSTTIINKIYSEGAEETKREFGEVSTYKKREEILKRKKRLFEIKMREMHENNIHVETNLHQDRVQDDNSQESLSNTGTFQEREQDETELIQCKARKRNIKDINLSKTYCIRENNYYLPRKVIITNKNHLLEPDEDDGNECYNYINEGYDVNNRYEEEYNENQAKSPVGYIEVNSSNSDYDDQDHNSARECLSQNYINAQNYSRERRGRFEERSRNLDNSDNIDNSGYIINIRDRNNRSMNRPKIKYPCSPQGNDIEFERAEYLSPPANRFRNVTLAMLSSKGPHCEDRKITRKMRCSVGGVVDLNREITPKRTYKIVKMTKYKKTVNYDVNPKLKIQAAKTIQSWWRHLKTLEEIEYQMALKNIVKVQAAIRGFIARQRFFKVISLKLYYQSFINKINKCLSHKIRRHIFIYLLKKIYGYNINYQSNNKGDNIDIYNNEQKLLIMRRMTMLKYIIKNLDRKYKNIKKSKYFILWKTELFGDEYTSFLIIKEQEKERIMIKEKINNILKIIIKNKANKNLLILSKAMRNWYNKANKGIKVVTKVNKPIGHNIISHSNTFAVISKPKYNPKINKSNEITINKNIKKITKDLQVKYIVKQKEFKNKETETEPDRSEPKSRTQRFKITKSNLYILTQFKPKDSNLITEITKIKLTNLIVIKRKLNTMILNRYFNKWKVNTIGNQYEYYYNKKTGYICKIFRVKRRPLTELEKNQRKICLERYLKISSKLRKNILINKFKQFLINGKRPDSTQKQIKTEANLINNKLERQYNFQITKRQKQKIRNQVRSEERYEVKVKPKKGVDKCIQNIPLMVDKGLGTEDKIKRIKAISKGERFNIDKVVKKITERGMNTNTIPKSKFVKGTNLVIKGEKEEKKIKKEDIRTIRNNLRIVKKENQIILKGSQKQLKNSEVQYIAPDLNKAKQRYLLRFIRRIRYHNLNILYKFLRRWINKAQKNITITQEEIIETKTVEIRKQITLKNCFNIIKHLKQNYLRKRWNEFIRNCSIRRINRTFRQSSLERKDNFSIIKRQKCKPKNKASKAIEFFYKTKPKLPLKISSGIQYQVKTNRKKCSDLGVQFSYAPNYKSEGIQPDKIKNKITKEDSLNVKPSNNIIYPKKILIANKKITNKIKSAENLKIITNIKLKENGQQLNTWVTEINNPVRLNIISNNKPNNQTNILKTKTIDVQTIQSINVPKKISKVQGFSYITKCLTKSKDSHTQYEHKKSEICNKKEFFVIVPKKEIKDECISTMNLDMTIKVKTKEKNKIEKNSISIKGSEVTKEDGSMQYEIPEHIIRESVLTRIRRQYKLKDQKLKLKKIFFKKYFRKFKKVTKSKKVDIKLQIECLRNYLLKWRFRSNLHINRFDLSYKKHRTLSQEKSLDKGIQVPLPRDKSEPRIKRTEQFFIEGQPEDKIKLVDVGCEYDLGKKKVSEQTVFSYIYKKKKVDNNNLKSEKQNDFKINRDQRSIDKIIRLEKKSQNLIKVCLRKLFEFRRNNEKELKRHFITRWKTILDKLISKEREEEILIIKKTIIEEEERKRIELEERLIKEKEKELNNQKTKIEKETLLIIKEKNELQEKLTIINNKQNNFENIKPTKPIGYDIFSNSYLFNQEISKGIHHPISKENWKKIIIILTKYFKEHDNSHKLKHCYLMKYKYIIEKLISLENDKIIQNFCRNKLRYLLTRKKWIEFSKRIAKHQITEIINMLMYNEIMKLSPSNIRKLMLYLERKIQNNKNNKDRLLLIKLKNLLIQKIINKFYDCLNNKVNRNYAYFFNNLKRFAELNGTHKMSAKEKIRKLVIKKYIRKLKKVTTTIIYYNRLYYLIRCTRLNSIYAKKRFIHLILLCWLIYTRNVINKKKRVQNLYEKMLKSYKNVANDVFGVNQKENPSIQDALFEAVSSDKFVCEIIPDVPLADYYNKIKLEKQSSLGKMKNENIKKIITTTQTSEESTYSYGFRRRKNYNREEEKKEAAKKTEQETSASNIFEEKGRGRGYRFRKLNENEDISKDKVKETDTENNKNESESINRRQRVREKYGRYNKEKEVNDDDKNININTNIEKDEKIEKQNDLNNSNNFNNNNDNNNSNNNTEYTGRRKNRRYFQFVK